MPPRLNFSLYHYFSISSPLSPPPRCWRAKQLVGSLLAREYQMPKNAIIALSALMVIHEIYRIAKLCWAQSPRTMAANFPLQNKAAVDSAMATPSGLAGGRYFAQFSHSRHFHALDDFAPLASRSRTWPPGFYFSLVSPRRTTRQRDMRIQ